MADEVHAGEKPPSFPPEEGWTAIPDEGFVGVVGPFFQRTEGDGLHLVFPTEYRHRNRNGDVVQGGALMTFADRAIGQAARFATGASKTSTIQLDVHFVSAVKIGQVVETRPRVIRATRQLIFLSALLTVGEQTVASCNGLWRKLDERP